MVKPSPRYKARRNWLKQVPISEKRSWAKLVVNTNFWESPGNKVVAEWHFTLIYVNRRTDRQSRDNQKVSAPRVTKLSKQCSFAQASLVRRSSAMITWHGRLFYRCLEGFSCSTLFWPLKTENFIYTRGPGAYVLFGPCIGKTCAHDFHTVCQVNVTWGLNGHICLSF